LRLSFFTRFPYTTLFRSVHPATQVVLISSPAPPGPGPEAVADLPEAPAGPINGGGSPAVPAAEAPGVAIVAAGEPVAPAPESPPDRKSTRLNSSHVKISY